MSYSEYKKKAEGRAKKKQRKRQNIDSFLKRPVNFIVIITHVWDTNSGESICAGGAKYYEVTKGCGKTIMIDNMDFLSNQ